MSKTSKAVYAALVILLVGGALALGLYFGLPRTDRRAYRVGDPCQPYSPPAGDDGTYTHAAVAADSGQCSKIGSDTLEKGGSAVDAAIATLLCVGLLNGQSSGIGGGHFMTIYDRATNTAQIINARETAPAAATENMYQGNLTLSTEGGLAVAVPGEIRGYWEAHRRYGKLPWSDLFQPAIQLAEGGFCIGASLAAAIIEKTPEIKKPWSTLCDIYCDENNNVLAENTIVKQPQLAKTLRAVAVGGADAFYTGEIARNLAKDIQGAGGIVTEEDIRSYQVEVKDPLNISLSDGLTVLSPPPPSSGAVLSLILNILDGYKLNSTSVGDVDSRILTYHRIVEAFKFAYAKRSELGDPNFVEISELVRNMTSHDFAESLRARISDVTTHDYRYYGPSFVLPQDGGTSHVSVLAPNGDAVSVTSTINLFFGSKLRSASTGVILNNLMDDFSSPNLTNYFGVPPSPSNFIRPGKRAMSSMSPTVVVDGKGDVRLVVGASGGTKITTETAYVTMQHLWFGLGVGPALGKPRLHHQLIPDYIETETSRPFEQAVLEGLRQKNHVINTDSYALATVNGVAKSGDVISAASDPKRWGFPAGY